MSVLFTAIFSGIDLIWDRQFGFLKETLVAPVPRYQIMLGKTLGGATVAMMQGVIVFVLTLLLGFRPVSWGMLPVAWVVVMLVAILFTSLGVAIASRLSDMQGFQLIMNFLVMPINFLSGAFFPLSGLPVPIEMVTKINPLSYGVDALRGVLIGVSTFGIGTDLAVLTILSSLLVYVGSRLFEKVEV